MFDIVCTCTVRMTTQCMLDILCTCTLNVCWTFYVPVQINVYLNYHVYVGPFIYLYNSIFMLDLYIRVQLNACLPFIYLYIQLNVCWIFIYLYNSYMLDLLFTCTTQFVCWTFTYVYNSVHVDPLFTYTR